MKPLRQLSVGIIIGLISAILVIGGIFLSLAETFPSLATPTQIPPTLQLNFPTITPSLASAQSETPTATAHAHRNSNYRSCILLSYHLRSASRRLDTNHPHSR